MIESCFAWNLWSLRKCRGLIFLILKSYSAQDFSQFKKRSHFFSFQKWIFNLLSDQKTIPCARSCNNYIGSFMLNTIRNLKFLTPLFISPLDADQDNDTLTRDTGPGKTFSFIKEHPHIFRQLTTPNTLTFYKMF